MARSSLALLLLAACGGPDEVGGNPPPSFPILEELDRTPDPACEGIWLAGIRGRVVDVAGEGVAGATVQHCLRLHDGRFVCTAPPQNEDGSLRLEMTDDEGWYAYVFDEEVRCVDELAVRVLHREQDLGTTYCHVPLAPERSVQLLPRPAVMYAVAPPAELPPLGDETTPRDVTFEGGVVLTDVIPDRLFDGDYEDLRGGFVSPEEPRPCFLTEGDELLGLFAFAPEIGSGEPLGLRLPNDAGLAEGAAVELLALGGLDTVRPDGSQIEEADFEPFGTATVMGDAIVSDPGVAVPSLTTIGWRVVE
jgi:hypothetical protein